MLIIPAIDLQQGRCVRLCKGQFDQVSVYDYTPITLAEEYVLQGAKRLHIVDLDGAKTGTIKQLSLIKAMHVPNLLIQVGGGIRSLETAEACLAASIDKLVLGSIAITNPSLTAEIINLAEADNIVLALDVHVDEQGPKPAIHGWQTTTDRNLWDIVRHYEQLGIYQILCTDIANDGMMAGPNFALYEEAIQRFPAIHWQASGGIRHLEDLEKLSSLGLSAAILGRMLYETDFDLSSVLVSNNYGR